MNKYKIKYQSINLHRNSEKHFPSPIKIFSRISSLLPHSREIGCRKLLKRWNSEKGRARKICKFLQKEKMVERRLLAKGCESKTVGEKGRQDLLLTVTGSG
ncbi:hypothetical protein RvY_14846 [Ramazzottius varieornatus]|uniref:Uncharacterized protein n=1 Tax=Ramazzottius varieornatus TaxID=947166 RepID=A0A1D1VSM6_RAMVA|nr:hypothetical protein RvY_14846 [Ramazzottius varieornatus]